MKFSEMKKEQKQLLILTIGGGITVLMIVSNLLVKPTKEAAAKAKEVISELETEVSRGEMILTRDPKVRRESQEASKDILNIVRSELPPQTGRYGWALENITGIYEELGVYFTMEETPGPRYVPVKTGQAFDPDSVSMWVPYSVIVKFQTSFENLKKILTLFKEKFPYSSIANMQIIASERDPENHNIRLVLEWPVFRFEEDLLWIEEQAGNTP